MATNHILNLQRPIQFHQTGKYIEVGEQKRGSLTHHHLLLNEDVCMYLLYRGCNEERNVNHAKNIVNTNNF